MRNIKQGLRSTKTKKEPTELKLEDGSTYVIPLNKHNDIYVRVDDPKEMMYTDQTGAFPVRSRRGNKYIMTLCKIDNNIIISKVMKNRTTGEMIRAYRALMRRLKAAGIKPKKTCLRQ
jgi:hypothetical protein